MFENMIHSAQQSENGKPLPEDEKGEMKEMEGMKNERPEYTEFEAKKLFNYFPNIEDPLEAFEHYVRKYDGRYSFHLFLYKKDLERVASIETPREFPISIRALEIPVGQMKVPGKPWYGPEVTQSGWQLCDPGWNPQTGNSIHYRICWLDDGGCCESFREEYLHRARIYLNLKRSLKLIPVFRNAEDASLLSDEELQILGLERP